MESDNKHNCCSSPHCDLPGFLKDSEMSSMVACAAILFTGFLLIAFVSGPLGLMVTLALLAVLGLFYAIKG